jgi:hypothetical protein
MPFNPLIAWRAFFALDVVYLCRNALGEIEKLAVDLTSTTSRAASRDR